MIIISFLLVSIVGIANVAASVFVSREFGTNGLGMFASILAFGQVFGTICGTTFGTYALAYLPRTIAVNRSKAIPKANLLFIVSCSLALFTSVFFLVFWPDNFQNNYPLLIAIAILAISVQNISRDILRCFGYISRSYFVLLVSNSTIIAALSITYVAPLEVIKLTDLLIVAFSFSLIYSTYCLSSVRLINWSDGLECLGNLVLSEKSKPLTSIFPYFLTFFPMLIAAVAQVTLLKTDILIAAHFGSESHAGELAAAAVVASVSIMGLAAINAVYVPKINAADNRTALSLLREVQLLGFVATAIFSVVIILFDFQILQAFMISSSDTEKVLKILILASLFNAITGPVIFIGIRIRKGRCIAAILCVAVAVNLLGNILIFDSYGIVGLAFVTALVSILINVTGYLFVNANLKIQLKD